jgi:hypothetical protein
MRVPNPNRHRVSAIAPQQRQDKSLKVMGHEEKACTGGVTLGGLGL